MFAPKRILVPTDYSEYADRALKQAIEIAKQFQSKIYLLHVNDVIQECAADYCMDYAALKRVREEVVEGTKKGMAAELAKFAEYKEVDVYFDIKEGDPGVEILKDVEEKDIELIVMSTRGKTGFIKHLLGGVADQVARHAKCSVLLVRK